MKTLTVSEVSEILNRSKSHIRALDDSGLLPATRSVGKQRRWDYLNVLAYANTQNIIKTFVLCGYMGLGEDDREEINTKAVKFCSQNKFPSIRLIDDFIEHLPSDPLLISRHVVAQLVEFRPKIFVIANPDSLDISALLAIVNTCKLYRIDLHLIHLLPGQEG
jgi:excisionase family DNA binding protein